MKPQFAYHTGFHKWVTFGQRVVCGIVPAVLWGLISQAAPSPVPETGATGFGRAPVSFEENFGQAEGPARFIARGPAYLFSLSATGATVSLRKVEESAADGFSKPGRSGSEAAVRFRAMQMEFVGANPGAQVSGEGQMPGRVNYFIGNDAANWRTGLPLFERVRVKAMYPGIDLVHYGNQQHLEYDFELAPETDPAAIAIRFSGVDHLVIDEQGDLILGLGADEIRQPKPVIYQNVAGSRKPISGGYVLADEQTIKFQVGAYDRRLPLVIDPVLSYSTYYGGSGKDAAWGVVVGADGSVYVSGESMSGLPTTAGTLTTPYHGGTVGHGDAFVAKFDNSATNVIYLSYIGGGLDDVALSLAVDAGGSAYVTGWTDSTDFPRTNAIFNLIKGTPYPAPVGIYPADAFVTKLGPLGTNLVYSTYLGGDWVDAGYGIAVDPAGNAYVAGYTQSSNFPTANVQGTFTNYSGGIQIYDDAFVTKIGPAGTNLIYSMFLGGSRLDQARGIVADAAGLAYVTGLTSSTNFPVTTNALQPWLAGKKDAFVTVIGPYGSNLISSTYLGGVDDNEGYNLTLDSNLNIYVTGYTVNDSAFPTTPGGINPGGVFRSANGGVVWDPVNSGLQSVQVFALAVDPVNPARVYAGTSHGIARSTNAGVTWNTTVKVAPMDRIQDDGPTIAIGEVLSVVIDPLATTTVYAGTGQGVFKSVDGGANWIFSSTNLNSSTDRSLAIDPVTPSTLYAADASGVYRSTNAAGRWVTINIGLANLFVRALAIDPVTPTTIYAATAGGVFRSDSSGTVWGTFNSGLTNTFTRALIVDPVNPSTLYVGTAGGLFKSLNRGTNWTWSSTGLTTSNVTALAIDPVTPSTLYAGTTNGLFKSLDGGLSWKPFSAGLPVLSLRALAVNPQTPDTVYAGTLGANYFGGNDVFLTKLGSNGFSVVFGGSSDEEGWDVAVAASGRIHVVGSTASTDFPTLNTSGSLRDRNSGGRDVFLTQLAAEGSVFLSSAYLGGAANDWGNGIALDASGNAYIVGSTFSINFPTVDALQKLNRGSSDAFLAKIANIQLNPRLEIQSLGNQVQLTWSVLASDYHLQFNTNLQTVGGWTDVGGVPVESNGELSISLPATNSTQFFRLSNP